MQVRDRYDGRLGKQEVSFTLMYGFAPGNKPMLERITRPVDNQFGSLVSCNALSGKLEGVFCLCLYQDRRIN